MKTLISVDPATEALNGEYEAFGFSRCVEAVQAARRVFPEWSRRSPAGRAALLSSVAAVLRDNKRKYADIITREMGKPVRQSLGEVEKCAWLCDYYAENAEGLLGEEIVETGASKSRIVFDPLGVILGVMPWNFPFWQVFRFAVPALAAGNVCLLKHASNVPGCALEIERIFRAAGYPDGAFQTLLVEAKDARELVVKGLVDGVSLTGSLQAGADIGAAAGGAVIPVVLELGGSDPFIVLDDADLDLAARTAVTARTLNGGQSCIAAKRFIVMEAVAKEFCRLFLKRLRELKVGDPMGEGTDIGPLAKKEFVDDLELQVRDAVAGGAQAHYGPEIPAGPGYYFRPVMLTGVKPGMKVLTEEVFGPVAPVLVVKNEEEALQWAEATEFGLGASVWSRNAARAEALGRRIRTGTVAVNDMVKSDPRLPFGGVKHSGLGRELSNYGLKAFVNVKTIVVA